MKKHRIDFTSNGQIEMDYLAAYVDAAYEYAQIPTIAEDHPAYQNWIRADLALRDARNTLWYAVKADPVLSEDEIMTFLREIQRLGLPSGRSRNHQRARERRERAVTGLVAQLATQGVVLAPELIAEVVSGTPTGVHKTVTENSEGSLLPDLLRSTAGMRALRRAFVDAGIWST